MSFFASVEMAPGDPILGLTETFLADSRPNKVNLGVGIYVDENGKVPLLRSVHEVEKGLVSSARPRGYLPIDGMRAYNQLTQKLLFGADSALLGDGRVATAQTIGGSAALRVAADMLKQIRGDKAKIAISNPSWGNHHVVFGTAGLELLDYRYYDPATHGLDFAGMLEDLGKLEPEYDRVAACVLPQPHRRGSECRAVAAGDRLDDRAQAFAVHRHGLPGL